jgi:Flp pilus assembly protein TadD
LLQGDAAGAERAFRQTQLLTRSDAAGQARALNNLAVLAETRGDRAAARDLYAKAVALLAPGPEREAVAKNLERVRETR